MSILPYMWQLVFYMILLLLIADFSILHSQLLLLHGQLWKHVTASATSQPVTDNQTGESVIEWATAQYLFQYRITDYSKVGQMENSLTYHALESVRAFCCDKKLLRKTDGIECRNKCINCLQARHDHIQGYVAFRIHCYIWNGKLMFTWYQ